MTRGDGVRLFVGVPVSVECTESIAEAARSMKAAADAAGLGARWVPPVNYHVTLAFLGWCRPEAVAAVRDAVGQALGERRGAFDLVPSAAGAFPDVDRGRVLWLGVDAAAEQRLGRLARAVADAVAALGFDRDRRPFHAHITVGRLKEVADVRPVVLAGAEQRHSPSATQAVVLYESQASASGSEYRVLARWPL